MRFLASSRRSLPRTWPGSLAQQTALSRLVAHDRAGDKWMLRHGPFDEAMFPQLGDHDWTLLVQDVEKWDADVNTAFKYAENTGQMAPIREQAGTFADSIKLWSAT